MKPIDNVLLARSIALIARTNRRIEKVLGFKSHNNFLSQPLVQIENIVRSETRISKNFLTGPINILISADIIPRLLLIPLQLDDYSTRLKCLGGWYVRI